MFVATASSSSAATARSRPSIVARSVCSATWHHSRGDRAGARGLGLPTAKRFVEAHDGEITIDYPPDGGTAVLVTLPLHTA
jgi:signal transduction histidine kinase